MSESLKTYVTSLTITQGVGAGAPLKLLPWQARFLRGAFGPHSCGDAALSISRGNGKSTLVAAIACAAVDGPLRQPRAEVVVVASSFGQARIVFEHVLAFLGARLEKRGEAPLSDRRAWRVQDSANTASVSHQATGARVRCIGSDPKRAMGLAPAIVIADEPAQWEDASRDKMRAALATSMGKIPGSRMISLGTRPDDDTHWFAKMLDAPGEDGYSQVHAAGDDDSIFNKRTWAEAKAPSTTAAMPSAIFLAMMRFKRE